MKLEFDLGEGYSMIHQVTQGGRKRNVSLHVGEGVKMTKISVT